MLPLAPMVLTRNNSHSNKEKIEINTLTIWHRVLNGFLNQEVLLVHLRYFYTP